MAAPHISPYNQFAMGLFKIAQNRALMSRFDRLEIEERIRQLPTYRAAMATPDLVSSLTAEFASWRNSKNLYVVISIVGTMQAAAACDNAPAEEPAPEGEDADVTEMEAEDEDRDEEVTAKVVVGLRKYIDLIESAVGIDEIRSQLRKRRLIGGTYDAGRDWLTRFQYRLYAVRAQIKHKKNLIDDFAYELAARILSREIKNPLVKIALIFLWAILSILGAALWVALMVMRPQRIPEMIGIDDEILPLPE